MSADDITATAVSWWLKPGSQYDAGASVALQVSGWCWNGLYFYSMCCVASIQPIRLSKNLTSGIEFWLVKKSIFLSTLTMLVMLLAAAS